MRYYLRIAFSSHLTPRLKKTSRCIGSKGHVIYASRLKCDLQPPSSHDSLFKPHSDRFVEAFGKTIHDDFCHFAAKKNLPLLCDVIMFFCLVDSDTK